MAQVTKLGVFGVPYSAPNTTRYDNKTVATAFQHATLIWQFALWRESYAGAVVEILKEGTTEFADVYADVNLSEPADNPQVLISQTVNSRDFGKFTVPLYTPDSYYLRINGIETTGVYYPGIRTLNGEDASAADVTSNKGGIPRTAGDRAAYTVHVLDFGNLLEVDGSASENTTTLEAAIGAAAAENGGDVILPAGTFKVTSFSLPENVVLRGQGMNATIIQSIEADSIVTVTGDYAGLRDMTLDGINLNPGSVGVLTIGHANLRLTDITIKRFAIGLKALGGSDHHYTNLVATNCGVCVTLRGDLDASNTNEGGDFTDLVWNGGSITESTEYGLHLKQVDSDVNDLSIRDLIIMDNVGTSAVFIEGATSLQFEDLTFTANTLRHLLTADTTGTTATKFANATFRSCVIDGDEIKIAGQSKDVTFERCILSGDLSIYASAPTYPVMFIDCVEAATVTQTGDTDKISRWQQVDAGVFRGNTTPTVSTATIFKRMLNPGELVHLTVIASAVQRNAAAFGTIKKTAAAYCPAATLNYDGQTVNFTTGLTLTGGTNGGTAILQTQTDGGASGTMNLINMVGTAFADNEPLSQSTGGAAIVDGSITYVDSLVIGPVQTDHYGQTAGATTFDVDVTTSGRELRIKAVGPTTGTIDWNLLIRQNDVP